MLSNFLMVRLYEAPKQTLNAVDQLILTTDCDQLVPERENEDLLNLKEEGRHGPVVEKAGGRKGLLQVVEPGEHHTITVEREINLTVEKSSDQRWRHTANIIPPCT